jgi:hypothetical protein
MFIWLIAAVVLPYAPFFFQRRLLEGGQFPMVIFAAIAIMAGYRWVTRRYPRFLKALMAYPIIVIFLSLALFGMSSMGLMTRDLIQFTEHHPAYYLDTDYIDAFRWVSAQGNNDAAVLTTAFIGNRLPGYANQPVFVGHFVETVDFEKKMQETEDFYSGLFAQDDAVRWLEEGNIGYVLWGPEEQRKQFQLGAQSYLEKVFSIGSVEVFEVIRIKN